MSAEFPVTIVCCDTDWHRTFYDYSFCGKVLATFNSQEDLEDNLVPNNIDDSFLKEIVKEVRREKRFMDKVWSEEDIQLDDDKNCPSDKPTDKPTDKPEAPTDAILLDKSSESIPSDDLVESTEDSDVEDSELEDSEESESLSDDMEMITKYYKKLQLLSKNEANINDIIAAIENERWSWTQKIKVFRGTGVQSVLEWISSF
jgi:hypothetical protein